MAENQGWSRRWWSRSRWRRSWWPKAAEAVSGPGGGGRGGQGGGRGRGRGRGRDSRQARAHAFRSQVETVIHINRVAKVVKGGRRFLVHGPRVAVGDQKGKVGVALAKANEVAEAIRKGLRACPSLQGRCGPIPLHKGTLPHDIIGRCRCWDTCCLRPAAPGTGVIAGAVRYALSSRPPAVTDVLTKSHGDQQPR